MAFQLVQHKPVQTSGANPTATYTSAPTQGNLIIAVIGTTELNVANLTNPSGWTQRAQKNENTTVGTVRIASKVAGAGESSTVTFTNINSRSYLIELYEYSGNAAAGSEFDAASAGASTLANSATLQPGSLTPAHANELFIVGLYNIFTNASPSIDSGFTIEDAATFTTGIVGDKIKTDALAENPTLSGINHPAVAIQCAFIANVATPFPRRSYGLSIATARASQR